MNYSIPGSQTPMLIITPTPSCPMTREQSARTATSARSHSNSTLSASSGKSTPSKLRLTFKFDSPEEMQRKTRNLMRSSRKYKPSFFGVSEDNLYRRINVKKEPIYSPQKLMKIIHRNTPSSPKSYSTHEKLQRIFSLSYEAENLVSSSSTGDCLDEFNPQELKRPSTSLEISQSKHRMFKLHNYLVERREKKNKKLEQRERAIQHNIEELELQIVKSAGQMPCTSQRIIERVRNRKKQAMLSEREVFFWKKRLHLQ